MCIGLEKEITVAGLLNQKVNEISPDSITNICISTKDVFQYANSLWDAGCGPVVRNFNESDLVSLFKTNDSLFEKKDREYYRVRFESFLGSSITDEKKEMLSITFFKLLKAQLTYPDCLYNYMNLDFLFKK